MMLPPEPKTLVPQRKVRPPPVDRKTIGAVLKKIDRAMAKYEPPVVTLIAQAHRDPFKVLISTMLSARTRDTVTAAASQRLFAVADTAQRLSRLPQERLAAIIAPVGFPKTKAKALKETSRIIIEQYGGQVPDTIDELIKLPGVGRKTANLVLIEGFRKPAICVDTHVHRISNIWGFVSTVTPEQTEMALRERLPLHHWQSFNRLLVGFGQHICVPVSPKCTRCPVLQHCPRIGVQRSR